MGAPPFERKKQAKQEETYAKSKQSLPTVIVCVCVTVGVSMRVCLCASVTIFNAITVQHSSRESNRQNRIRTPEI